jgi:hypothetical protein
VPGCRYAARNSATRLRVQVGELVTVIDAGILYRFVPKGPMRRGVRRCYPNAEDPGVPEGGKDRALAGEQTGKRAGFSRQRRTKGRGYDGEPRVESREP